MRVERVVGWYYVGGDRGKCACMNGGVTLPTYLS